jgi:hypothetical protein
MNGEFKIVFEDDVRSPLINCASQWLLLFFSLDSVLLPMHYSFYFSIILLNMSSLPCLCITTYVLSVLLDYWSNVNKKEEKTERQTID